MTRVLVGGVGYRNLCDHSFGVMMIDDLASQPWESRVAVEDCSYNPIAFMQRLEDDAGDDRFGLAVMIGAVLRRGRAPGTVRIYRWDKVLPPPDEIHSAITEAVTGVIAFENTLVIAAHFGVLPDTVVVVEVQPLLHDAGEQLSPPVAAAYPAARAAIVALAQAPERAADLPVGALGDDPVTDARFGIARISDLHARRN